MIEGRRGEGIRSIATETPNFAVDHYRSKGPVANDKASSFPDRLHMVDRPTFKIRTRATNVDMVRGTKPNSIHHRRHSALSLQGTFGPRTVTVPSDRLDGGKAREKFPCNILLEEDINTRIAFEGNMYPQLISKAEKG